MLRLVFLGCVVLNLALKDITGSSVPCSKDEFLCKDGSECINDAWRCDRDVDCADGSDELNCPIPVICSFYESLCKDGTKCINDSWLCDGKTDCADGSDELGCSGSSVSCSIDESLCKDGSMCIKDAWKCDGETDCADGSDELNCPRSCKINEFLCNDGQCVKKDWRCDNEEDCSDGSDEIDCLGSSLGSKRDEPPCNGTECVRVTWMCDGEPGCPEGCDEVLCPATNTTRPTVPPRDTPKDTTDTTLCINPVSENSNISTNIPSFNSIQFQRGYALTDDRYYAFSLGLNWFQAVEFCYQIGKRLATFNSEADYNQLITLISQHNGTDQLASYWTAGSDLGQRGKWVWHTLGRPLMYTQWGRGEPSDLKSDGGEGVERCIELKSSKCYTMNDSPCDIENNVICENI